MHQHYRTVTVKLSSTGTKIFLFYIDPVLPVLPGLQWCERPEELDNLDEHPVVGGGGHELEEGGGQGQIVLGVLAGQLTDHVHSCRLGAAATTQAYIWPTLCRYGFRAVWRFRIWGRIQRSGSSYLVSTIERG